VKPDFDQAGAHPGWRRGRSERIWSRRRWPEGERPAGEGTPVDSAAADNGGCPGNRDSNTCSGITQNTWDFSHLLEPFTG
jgi:hypothetical protein